jgi:hypothetical protein
VPQRGTVARTAVSSSRSDHPQVGGLKVGEIDLDARKACGEQMISFCPEKEPTSIRRPRGGNS